MRCLQAHHPCDHGARIGPMLFHYFPTDNFTCPFQFTTQVVEARPSQALLCRLPQATFAAVPTNKCKSPYAPYTSENLHRAFQNKLFFKAKVRCCTLCFYTKAAMKTNHNFIQFERTGQAETRQTILFKKTKGVREPFKFHATVT